ncbi:hypothetical protein GCM10008915_69990 [Bifidobacterium pullorum subsp. gallinarum]
MHFREPKNFNRTFSCRSHKIATAQSLNQSNVFNILLGNVQDLSPFTIQYEKLGSSKQNL